MMPVSSASSPVDTAGSIATTMRTKSGMFRWTGQRVSSISARHQRAPGTSSKISALSSCRPSRVPSYLRTICCRNAGARLARLSYVEPRVITVVGSANFEREHLEIPAGVERQLVVGEHIGAALRRREVRQDDARHLVEAEQMRSEHPAVAGNNAVLFVNQHRVGEAKFAHRGCELRDVLVAVSARVSGARDQRRAPAPNDRLG